MPSFSVIRNADRALLADVALDTIDVAVEFAKGAATPNGGEVTVRDPAGILAAVVWADGTVELEPEWSA